ncbi:MAG: cyclic nucleotide-binding and patatin-like phospholipase domain-containing protein [Granulosicoccaceae bacterium]
MPFIQDIDDERWRNLASHISFLDINEGEVLFSEGKQSENLYLVMSGEISLYMPASNEGEGFYLHSRTKGETAGDFAVLNGGLNLVTAIAAKTTKLAKFPRFAFELLVDISPQVLALVYDTAADLSQRVMLSRVFLDLFGEVTTSTMNSLLDGTEIRQYKSGELIIGEGDEADGLHIVVSGRLSVETLSPKGERLPLAEVRAPETVGELALLTDTPRSASVFAMRESAVAFLRKSLFNELIAQKPNMLMSLSKLIVQRHIENERTSGLAKADQTFVIIPMDKRLPLRRFLNQLKVQIKRTGDPMVLHAGGFDTLYGKTGAAQTPFDDPFNSAITEWLDDKENTYQQMIYVANREWTAWSRRCVNRADRVLLVANADGSNTSELRGIELALNSHFAEDHHQPRVELVLLHATDTEQPTGTIKWLEKRNLHAHHHIRIDDSEHIARLARRMSGTARGIVFSGGGARGYAHLGVQKLIEEQEIDIDYIGGSSMGGLLGASMAMGQTTNAIFELSKTFASKKALFDYTFPISSLMKSSKLTHFCKTVYGEKRIEDLWIPFFCVSSNLFDGEVVLHDSGELWHVVRSTISLPGIFSPVPINSEMLLIDGAVLNTFPVDVMNEKLGSTGNIIGVNVSQIPELSAQYDYGTSLSGWQALLSRLNPLKPRMNVPRIAETLLRSTDIKSIIRLNETKSLLDVLIEPDVSEISLLDFKSYERISEIGYDQAKLTLANHGLIKTHATVIEEVIESDQLPVELPASGST